ncbi:hypothetical protein L1049_010002 [Liquidambar formosana]|uniref:Pentatricopeptide repeat-containing protein n=1 Tax=Liquidambar formosana TaxID=63359 RepID=A0AAP0NAM6_LIQFO
MSSSLYRRLHNIFGTSLPTKSAQTCNTLKSLPTKESKLKELVDKFKKSSELGKFRSKQDVYYSTVHRLASAKQFSMIEDILEDQKKYKDISIEGFAIRLITLYGKSGMLDHAHKMFDEMPELQCERTVKSFNALLAACVNSKKFDKVEGVFTELRAKLSLEPNVVSYNTVIKAFCEMGSLDSALSWVDEMERNGLDANLITYNTLLDAFYRNNRFLDGEKIWAMMETKNVVPDIRSYNAKFRGLVFERRTSEAVELIEELRTKGLKPDVLSFNALIKSFCNDGNIEEAKRWYKELMKCKCVPNWVTFTTLVPFLCEKGEFDMAFKICKKIMKRHYPVKKEILQLVVDGLVKESKLEEATELVELGRSNSFRYKLELCSDK